MIFNKPKQVAASLIFCFLLVFGLLIAITRGVDGLNAYNKSENAEQGREERQAREQSLDTAATGTAKITKETERVGGSLYRYASLAFEVASLLLLVAIIGSVMLARTIKQEAAVDDVAPEVLQEEIKREPELATLGVVEEATP
jgi:NADH:ubiquinone oxidoreductase subunit 6 (subunit J)